jgi:DNA-binding MarR family transcriptional regulator
MTTLAEELKSKDQNLLPHQEAFLSLLVTANRMASRHEDSFCDFGISSKQYNILRILRGGLPDGLPVMEVGRRMIERSPDISRIINRLLDAGYVKRVRQSSDRRVAIVTITAKGLQLLEQMDKPIEKSIHTMLGSLSEAELATIIELMDKARDSVLSSGEVKRS